MRQGSDRQTRRTRLEVKVNGFRRSTCQNCLQRTPFLLPDILGLNVTGCKSPEGQKSMSVETETHESDFFFFFIHFRDRRHPAIIETTLEGGCRNIVLNSVILERRRLENTGG